MKQIRPKEMNLIGSLYVFEALMVLLVFIVRGDEGLYTGLREIISDVPAILLIPVITLVKLLMAYGYLTMKKWGYWLILLYSTVVILMNSYLMLQFGLQLYIWQTMFSVYVLKHTVETRTLFLNSQTAN